MRIERKLLQYSSVMDCGEKEAHALLNNAFATRLANFGNDLLCYAPSLVPYSVDQFDQDADGEFIAFSITGTRCQLQCEHCQGKILASLRPVSSPEELYQIVKACVLEKGCEGILVSGGANVHGEVPLAGYPGVLRRLKDEFGTMCIVHSGLLRTDVARELAQAHVDAVMVDIIGDQPTVRDICHLDRPVTDYDATIQILTTAGVPLVPHIVVGLNYGMLKGEFSALEMVARHPPAALVLVVLVPVEGTAMESISPPDLGLVSRFIALARLTLPKTPIVLGCARPGGEYKQKLDISAIQGGINGIAYPCQEAVNYCQDHQLRPIFKTTCCSLAYRYFQPIFGGTPQE